MPGKTSYLFAFILIFFTHYSFGQSQIISGVFSSTEISAGDTPTLTISYQATSAAKTTGLGLRLHFDSSKLQIGGVTLNLNEAAQAVQVVDDSSDFDGDSSTDKIILTSWGDTTGDGWPQSASQPTVLYAVPFTALSGFDGTTIKFTASSTAAGYTLSASDISLNLSPIVVEAENYTAKIQNDDNKPEAQGTTDVGGGQSLGFIDGTLIEVKNNNLVNNKNINITGAGDTFTASLINDFITNNMIDNKSIYNAHKIASKFCMGKIKI